MTTKKQSITSVDGADGKEKAKPADAGGRQESGSVAASTPAPGGSKSGTLKDEPSP